MPDKLAVVILHYHLRPGGVTRVIERAVASLDKEVDVLCISGEMPDAADRLHPISKQFKPLAYDDHAQHGDVDQLVDECRALVRDYFGREPDLWHIHNHSLGKNSFTPKLVWNLAREGQRLLLQPHDFAEDGRAGNYALLKEQLQESLHEILYPTADHIWYAPINFRDKAFLKDIGASHVYELPNSVTAHPTDQNYTTKQTVVYPARAIRRKNLGEFLLWSLLAPEGWLFQSTLAPQNPKWKGYYDGWVAFAEEHGLPVEFDAGRKHDFTELVQSAAALMTTSIQEGFGLAFLEPWLEGKTLIGRKLPEITADFEAEGLNLSGLYDSLPVPLAWAGEDAFDTALESAMQMSYADYSKSCTNELIEQAKQSLVQHGRVDFGVLNEPLQQKVIHHLVLHPEDRSVLPAFSINDSSAMIEANRTVAKDRFSPEAYGARLLGLYRELAAAQPSLVRAADAAGLLDHFLKPERINLLRT